MEKYNQEKKEEISIKLNSQDSALKNNYNYRFNKLGKIGAIEELMKSNEDPILDSNSGRRSNSMKRKKDKINEIDKKKRKSMFKIEGKRTSTKKNKYLRKNPKKSIFRKNRDGNLGGTIKVVGKVSAKLETLIQRLEQNAGNDRISNTRTENKHVIAPKIKAALEMFNKKKEEPLEPIPFQRTRFRTVNLVGEDYKYQYSKTGKGKAKYNKEIDEDEPEFEDEEYEEEDEEEDDEGYEEDGNYDDKRIKNGKNGSSDKNESSPKKSEKNHLKFSDDSDSDNNNNNNKKRKRKKFYSSKDSDNNLEEYEDSDDINKRDNNIKKKFGFSDERGRKVHNINIKRKRKLHKHKSGKGHLIVNSKRDNRAYSSSSSNRSTKSDKKNMIKNNPISLLNNNEKQKDDNLSTIKKVNFSFKEYIVKKYHAKPYIIWKNQFKKYSLSKQVDFSVFAIIKKKPPKNLKTILFNNNTNDINKRKSNFKQGGRKSVFTSFNNNNLLNLAKRFDISRYEEKLTNIQKMKNALMNEAKTINSEYAKKRKRYQSILVADAKSFNDFGSRLNTSKEHSILKKKNNIKTNQRLSVFQILQKRGINPTFHENLYTDSNESFNKKRVKFSSRFSVFHNQNNNKNKGKKLENIPEKEEEVIKESIDGVKYIVFQNKNVLKKIYKKENWKLNKSNVISIFLRAIKPKEIKEIRKEKPIDTKNNSEYEKIYKNKFDNYKIEKAALKYQAPKNLKNQIKNFKNVEKESSIESNESESENNDNINKNRQKEQNLEKDPTKDDKYYSYNTLNRYFFNSPINASNNKENKPEEKNKLKTINSGNNISEAANKSDESGYFSEHVNRTYKRGLTMEVRKMPKKYEYILEEKEKKIGKVKSKKAKIKQFKSLRDDPEPVDNERRKKGNLYDYYSSKIPKKKKNYEKHENNDEFNINSKKKKTISNKNDYNYAHSKPKHIKRNNSDQSGDIKLKNNTSAKKHKIKINTNFLNKKNNSSLTTNYRQKMLEKIQNIPSNKKNDSRNTKENINNRNHTISSSKRKKEKTHNLNSSMEMIGIDAIKSRMKKKLIEINNNLLDAVEYYNGPIDISCISLKNYSQTVEDLIIRALKNGYKCSKIENNLYNLSNQFNSFSVKIIKIRNNMLYYLIVKNE